MKRTLINKPVWELPRELEKYISGANVFDSSCSPEARVYFIDKESGYYLKKSACGTLENEAKMNSYFHTRSLGPEVIAYISQEHDWLLTKKVSGEDCTHQKYLCDPKRLCDTIAEKLRELHEIDASDCPVQNRMESYFALADQNYLSGNYDSSAFPDSFGYKSAEEARAVLLEGRDCLKNEVLIHGDYCLPNIILDDWRFSSFIDLGNGGIGDRHIDLFWGAWTLMFNLKTDAYRERFFDAYGNDKIDRDKLRIVAAAEVFG